MSKIIMIFLIFYDVKVYFKPKIILTHEYHFCRQHIQQRQQHYISLIINKIRKMLCCCVEEIRTQMLSNMGFFLKVLSVVVRCCLEMQM